MITIKNTLTVLALAVFAHLPAYAETPLSTVAQVDVARYSGQWYEIARLPMRFQAQCVADVSANYRVNDNGSIAVTNRCRQADGSWDQAEGLARAEDSSNSRLRVTFLPKGLRWLPFGKAPYWIMALDSNYQTAMVGEPGRRYLWLLSRTPQMDDAVYQAYLQQAQAQGYDLSALIHTRHSPTDPTTERTTP